MVDRLLIGVPLALAVAAAIVLANRHRAKRGKTALPSWFDWLAIGCIVVVVAVIA